MVYTRHRLAARFEKHAERHSGIAWAKVLAKLEDSAAAMESLAAMEESGGEPDVIGFDAAKKQFLFCDCAPESPVGRRSLC